jgi:AbiV family abortive infection protein
MVAGRLSLEQLAELSVAAVENSNRLLEEAVLLRDAGRHERALALAVLAIEELGKHFVVRVAVIANALDREEFWQAFRRLLFQGHEFKSAMGTWLTELDIKRADWDKEWGFVRLAERMTRAKLSALYVDVSKEGAVLSPKDRIDPEHVSAVLEAYGDTIRNAADQVMRFDELTLLRKMVELRPLEATTPAERDRLIAEAGEAARRPP